MHLVFLSEIDPIGTVLLDIMISYTITVQEIQGGGALRKTTG